MEIQRIDNKLRQKILTLAAEICWLHAKTAGNRLCQDWTGETENIARLTAAEKNLLMFQYELFNSDGEDYAPGDFPMDEMVISSVVAYALETMIYD